MTQEAENVVKAAQTWRKHYAGIAKRNYVFEPEDFEGQLILAVDAFEAANQNQPK